MSGARRSAVVWSRDELRRRFVATRLAITGATLTIKRSYRKALTGNPPPQDRVKHRQSEPIDELLPQTVSWMATLAFELRPRALSRTHPRIANELAALWARPDALASYLNELFAAGQGGRRRFPIRIARELHALRAYHVSLHLGAPASDAGKPA